MYWEFEYPYGMVGVDTRDILDLYECGIMVETTNRNFGKVASILRCDDNGPFNRNAKLNLLLCVSADEDAPITFHETWIGEDYTLEILQLYVVIDRALCNFLSWSIFLFHYGQFECP